MTPLHWLSEVADLDPYVAALLEMFHGGYSPLEAAQELAHHKRQAAGTQPLAVRSRRLVRGRGRANPSAGDNCFGLADVQVAAVMEALLSGGAHPQYARARRMAQDVLDTAHQRRVERGRRMMQGQIDDMDSVEFATFRRIHDLDRD